MWSVKLNIVWQIKDKKSKKDCKMKTELGNEELITELVRGLFERGSLQIRSELINAIDSKDDADLCLRAIMDNFYDHKRANSLDNLWYPLSLFFGNDGCNQFTKKIEDKGYFSKLKKYKTIIAGWEREWYNIPEAATLGIVSKNDE